MNKKKAFILDYDGVIAESNQIKTQAFREIFKNESKGSIEKFIKYHLINEGISRQDKIKYFYQNIIKKKISKKELTFKSKEFSDLVVHKIIDCKKVDGVTDFLEKNYKTKNLFISTGTPSKEINFILNKTNMINFFKDVLGSPESKYEHISFILKKYNYHVEDLLFIGDSKTDLKAAEEFGIEFILRTHQSNKKLCNYFKGHKIKNFFDIKKINMSDQ